MKQVDRNHDMMMDTCREYRDGYWRGKVDTYMRIFFTGALIGIFLTVIGCGPQYGEFRNGVKREKVSVVVLDKDKDYAGEPVRIFLIILTDKGVFNIGSYGVPVGSMNDTQLVERKSLEVWWTLQIGKTYNVEYYPDTRTVYTIKQVGE